MARYVDLTGSGTRVSTPDAAVLDVNDFAIRIRCRPDALTAPASPQVLMAKDDIATQRSFYARFNNGAGAAFATRVAASGGNPFKTQAHSLTQGAWVWLQITYTEDRGDGNYRMRWFYSNQTTRDHSAVSWTQIGSDQIGATLGSTNVTTALLAIGAESNAGLLSGFNGGVAIGILLNAESGGSVVAHFDACLFPLGASAGATAVDTVGRTWTLEGAGAVIQDDGLGPCPGEGTKALRSPRYGLTRLARR